MLKPALFLVLGLGMSSAFADTRFDGFMQTVTGNKNTVTFGTGGTPIAVSTPPGAVPSVQAMGFTKTNEGVFMESIGSGKVPGTSKALPLSTKLKLSSLSIAKALWKGAGIAAAAGAAWSAGHELYDIWSDLGYLPCGNGVCTSSGPATPTGVFRFFYKASPVPDLQFESISAICKDAEQTQSLLTGAVTKVYTSFSESVAPANYPQTVGQAQLEIGRCVITHYSSAGQNLGTKLSYIGVINRYVSSAPQSPASESDVVSNLATRTNWPDKVTEALKDSIGYAEGKKAFGDDIEANPNIKPVITVPGVAPGQSVVIGDPVVTEEVVTNPDGTSQTKRSTRTLEVTANGNELTSAEKLRIEIFNRNALGETVSSQTLPETTVTPSQPGTSNPSDPSPLEDLITCGLPDTPACKIDEGDTPTPLPDQSQEQADTVFEPVRSFLQDLTGSLPAFPSVSWSFSLPSSCGSIPIPGKLGEHVGAVDVCQFQSIFHDIMSMVWLAAGLFAGIGMFNRYMYSGA